MSALAMTEQTTSFELPPVAVFTKPDCGYCKQVKETLDRAGVSYTVFATEEDSDLAKWSVYLTGQVTLPQVVVAGHPLGGAAELGRLEAAGRLGAVIDTATRAGGSGTQRVEPLLQDFDAACSSVRMREFIEPSDGTQSTEPEELPILHFYKMFFGWWPHCYFYLHRYPEAYKTFIYSTLMSVAGGQARQLLGGDLLCAVAFSTSEAQGCSYCQIHTAATTEHSLDLVAKLKDVRADRIEAGSSGYSELELALAELAGKASLNEVADGLLERVRTLAGDRANDYIEAVGQIASVFGFLNTFNDLTSVDIEGGWNRQVQGKVPIEVANHAGTTTDNPDNLNFDIPKGTESFPGMIEKYERAVGADHEAYLRENLGIYPDWIAKWYAPYQKRHAYMYVRLMNDPDSSVIDPELRHLMARAAALTKDHEYLAAAEGYMAYRAADDRETAVTRIALCYQVACGTDAEPDRSPFTPAERAALALARTSALIPLKTSRKLAGDLLAHYDRDALVQLFSICAVSGLVQRWTAVAKPEVESEVSDFYGSHDLPVGAIHYKLPK